MRITGYEKDGGIILERSWKVLRQEENGILAEIIGGVSKDVADETVRQLVSRNSSHSFLIEEIVLAERQVLAASDWKKATKLLALVKKIRMTLEGAIVNKDPLLLKKAKENLRELDYSFDTIKVK